MESTAAETEPDDEHDWLPKGHAPFAGKYAIERVLGQGGMGVVVAARHIRVGQRVAIKVLGSALREYPELVARFEREARAAGSLTSAHAVRVFDIDTTEDGTPYIVMELLEGRDLADIVEKDGPLDVARAVRLVLEACEAIVEAHSLGIIHRDIKPSNLFLTEVDGKQIVKVLDFGIAKHAKSKEASITTAIAPLGTPQYMSPEQVRCAKDVDVRTDVWSIGVTLYELLTGRTPFAHESASACIASIAADPVPDPRTFRAELPSDLVRVMLRALEKNPAHRFPSVESLVDALSVFVEPRAPIADPPRAERISAPDRTVPPAISRLSDASQAPPRRNVARIAALFGATAMAAAIILPRCVALVAPDAPKPSAAMAAEIASVAPLPPPAIIEVPRPVAPVAAVVEEGPAPAVEPPIPTPVVKPSLPIHAAPPAPPPPSLTAHLAADPFATPSGAPDPKKRPRARAEIAVHNLPHGGLSSPGF